MPLSTGQKATGVTAALALALAAATPVVSAWEGRRNDPYLDIAKVWTVCDGETNVAMRRYSNAECDAMLTKSLTKHAVAITQCLPPVLPTKTHAAFISFGYNVGSGAFCGSSLSRKAKAGDLWGACAELSRWNRARVNGVLRVVKGLDNRRKAERSLCEAGLLR